jgi:hypothetical protein
VKYYKRASFYCFWVFLCTPVILRLVPGYEVTLRIQIPSVETLGKLINSRPVRAEDGKISTKYWFSLLIY